ncbi:MAG: hypothetical protein GY929_10145 [Actinomycetia bacterium]|nr:hypothetical protein [Actinomycetes bacterium]
MVRDDRRGRLVVGALAVVVAVLVGLTVLSPGADDPPGCFGTTRLGVYEWRDEWRSAAYPEMLDRLADACVDRVYVDITGAAVTDEAGATQLGADLETLAAAAATRDIEVGAVAGDPWWPSVPDNPEVARLLGFAAALQAPAGPLVAVHLDVEPWGLDEWATSRAPLTNGYLEYVAFVEGQRSAVGLTVPVAHLVPYWFDGTTDAAEMVSVSGLSAYPLTHLVEAVDAHTGLVVMAYRNQARGPGGIGSLAAEELALHRAVTIGVEAGPVDPASATFHGQGWATFVAEVELVVDDTGVDEVVVNDAQSLLVLRHSTG